MNTLTREEISNAARHVWNMTGGKPRPEVTAESYRQAAEGMRRIAARAGYGKSRGITAADALAKAARQDELAVEVPAELRRMMAAA